MTGIVKDQGHNMSVLGSQVDVDMDESVPDPVPKHQGHTGTGCYKLHDHEFLRPRHRPPRKGGGIPGGEGGGGGPPQVPPTNIMDLPVDAGPPNPVQLNAHNALKTKVTSPAQRTPDCKKLISHPNFHGGSIETTDSNNIIELNNFSEFGPKKASGDFGSVDSSEFLGTWAFPSQGSLANIELLAAQGSMGPNGSINNSVS